MVNLLCFALAKTHRNVRGSTRASDKGPLRGRAAALRHGMSAPVKAARTHDSAFTAPDVSDPDQADNKACTFSRSSAGSTSRAATALPTLSPTRLNKPRRKGRTIAPPCSMRLK